MDRAEFDRLEYQSLREEIRETRDRIFKLAAVALIGLPSISAVANALAIDVLVMALPGFIIATMLLYLSESSALMRCGTYIKNELEPAGHWEHWLAEQKTRLLDDRRRVDKFAFWFFIIVFVLYYLSAAYLAVAKAWSLGTVWGVVAVAIYALIAGVFLLSLKQHYRIATQTL